VLLPHQEGVRFLLRFQAGHRAQIRAWASIECASVAHLGAQHSCRTLESLETEIPLLIRAQHGEEHGGVLQITADSHISKGHIAQIGVAKTLLQPLCEDALDLVG